MNKGDRDSRVRQFPYPVSAKGAVSRKKGEAQEGEKKEMKEKRQDEARRRNSLQGGKERAESRFEWSLSSRVAGCVSDEHFIWHNPVYESLNVHAHTADVYVCMRAFYFVGTARMDRKRPGLNAPGIGLRAFCVMLPASSWFRQSFTRAGLISPHNVDFAVVKGRRLSL